MERSICGLRAQLTPDGETTKFSIEADDGSRTTRTWVHRAPTEFLEMEKDLVYIAEDCSKVEEERENEVLWRAGVVEEKSAGTNWNTKMVNELILRLMLRYSPSHDPDWCIPTASDNAERAAAILIDVMAHIPHVDVAAVFRRNLGFLLASVKSYSFRRTLHDSTIKCYSNEHWVSLLDIVHGHLEKEENSLSKHGRRIEYGYLDNVVRAIKEDHASLSRPTRPDVMETCDDDQQDTPGDAVPAPHPPCARTPVSVNRKIGDVATPDAGPPAANEQATTRTPRAELAATSTEKIGEDDGAMNESYHSLRAFNLQLEARVSQLENRNSQLEMALSTATDEIHATSNEAARPKKKSRTQELKISHTSREQLRPINLETDDFPPPKNSPEHKKWKEYFSSTMLKKYAKEMGLGQESKEEDNIQKIKTYVEGLPGRKWDHTKEPLTRAESQEFAERWKLAR